MKKTFKKSSPTRRSQLRLRLEQALAFMPHHKQEQGARKASLHLDALLDEARLMETLDSDTLDYLLTAYRYREPFEAAFKKFRPDGQIKPAGLKDLWQIAFGAFATRTQVPFAAISSDVVDLADALFGPQTRGLTNAFCRSLSREGNALLEPFTRENARMLPAALRKRFAKEATTAERLGRNLLSRPEKGIGSFSKQGKYERLSFEDFKKERAERQAMDYGSWLFCQWTAEQIRAQFASGSELRILDACSAPGGKLMALYTLLKDQYRIKFTASDAKFLRLERLKENLRAWNLEQEIQVKQCDWTQTDTSTGENFDVVLADLPCSASGTLATQPDLLYSDLEARVRDLVPVQQALLQNLRKQLRNKGLLIACICSVDPEESGHIADLQSPAATFFSFAQSEGNIEGLKAWAFKT